MFEHIVVMSTWTASIRMFGEKRHPGEGLAAGGAGVLLHFGMCLEMSPEVGPVGKSSVAVLARERFFAGVGPDVSLEKPRPTERLTAEFALAGQCVRSYVHLEGS